MKAHIVRSDNILNREIRENHILVADLAQAPCVVLGSIMAVEFGLGAGADHLAGPEDQSCGLGLSDAHNGCCKTLGLVLDIGSFECDFVQIELHAEFCC